MGLSFKSCPCRTGKDLPGWRTVLSRRRLGPTKWASLLTVCAKQPWTGSCPRCQEALQHALLWAAPGQLAAQQRAAAPGPCTTPGPSSWWHQVALCQRLQAVSFPLWCRQHPFFAWPWPESHLCLLSGAKLRFLLLTDHALLPQARPLWWAVAAASQLHPLGGCLPLHPHLWHVLCLPVVSTACSQGPGCECVMRWGCAPGRGKHCFVQWLIQATRGNVFFTVAFLLWVQGGS